MVIHRKSSASVLICGLECGVRELGGRSKVSILAGSRLMLANIRTAADHPRGLASSGSPTYLQPVAKAHPRRNQVQRHDEHVYYILEIMSWRWSLSFGIADDPRRDPDPYHDVRHLTIQARFTRPRRLAEQTIELTFIPMEHLTHERRQDDHPRYIGAMNLRRVAQAIFSLPSDALPSLLPMLIAERFRYLVLHGTGLRYRQASVRSFQFEMQINEDDWPLDD